MVVQERVRLFKALSPGESTYDEGLLARISAVEAIGALSGSILVEPVTTTPTEVSRVLAAVHARTDWHDAPLLVCLFAAFHPLVWECSRGPQIRSPDAATPTPAFLDQARQRPVRR
jgi:hypothetical protein